MASIPRFSWKVYCRTPRHRRWYFWKKKHDVPLPKTIIFAPENGWLEYDRFLLGWPIFRWYVSFREGITSEKRCFKENWKKFWDGLGAMLNCRGLFAESYTSKVSWICAINSLRIFSCTFSLWEEGKSKEDQRKSHIRQVNETDLRLVTSRLVDLKSDWFWGTWNLRVLHYQRLHGNQQYDLINDIC